MLLFNKFLFLVIYGGFLFLPGLLVSVIAGIRTYRFLFALSISLLFFLIHFSIAGRYGLSVFSLTLSWLLALVAIFVVGVSIRRHVAEDDKGFCRKFFSPTFSPGMTAGIVVVSLIYFQVFGVYDELPADLYQHLDYAGNAYSELVASNVTARIGDLFNVALAQKVWYYLPALAAVVSGVDMTLIYPLVMVFSCVVFLLGVGLVADRLFRPFEFTRPQHQAVVILAVIFTATQMGVNVFSYLRYYSMAPGMINLVVYFSGLVALLDLMGRKEAAIRSLSLVLLALAVCLVIHMQEALFLLVSCVLLVTWYGGRTILSANSDAPARAVSVIVLLAMFAMILVGLWVFQTRFQIQPFGHHKVWPLPFSLPFLEQAYILNPGYQFYQVLTPWGVFVYLLFILNFRFLAQQPFLVLAMLSPLLTVFNPYFADIFMRTNNSTVLWRLCYLIPLHFVAAACLVRMFGFLRSGEISRRVGSTLGMVLLAGLLLPSFLGLPLNRYARITLADVPRQNSHHHWNDLLVFLRTLPADDAPVLTDPLTGYLIESMTDHHAYNYKFFPGAGYHSNPFVFPDYNDNPLSRYPNRLLIVNQRDGGHSKIGELSGHWYADVLQVSPYYHGELKEYLQGNPDGHVLLWSQDRISVYRLGGEGSNF